MRLKNIAAGAAVTAALGFGAIGLAGQAGADDNWRPWFDPIPPPGHVGHIVGIPPGHIGHAVGVPPGHWDKPWKWFH
ncbi:hypothetical protein [[Mycobacterium] burgundiense]|jgi:hypothetical protein|uniref:Uncharacterized protein n=1 Tax=[Mycobacterium] burgundiense TaxID=3064286 RepID=A0ABM9LGT1_9MYCO|nr:hypothetical protein [Mycolicibacterium sp. MU0053]CAJ1498757.1 hypothetical protein MU0053_001238 [Mycolicibacterium sp. MU0053]